ncbi:cyclin-C-like [Stegodyphus dumicola]|uniref:cyclin-C-like n=1 Tax=Stegodyphus dumicola TaxID=202533 RepID=UPI0015B13C8F|nr:cyclin-C-like [Stegodyphus dumicola]
MAKKTVALLMYGAQIMTGLMEFGVISNSRLISTCQTVVKNKFAYAYPQEFPYRMTHVLECEFYLLEMMDCCLVLYHPYRPLVYYVQDIGQEEALLPMAWKVINDSLRTDVCLLYPPHQIALACLHMACVILGKDCKQWFAELNVDMEKILEITRQILSLYDAWKQFDEKKEVPALLAKVPKPKTQPTRYVNGSQNVYVSHGSSAGIVCMQKHRWLCGSEGSEISQLVSSMQDGSNPC